MNLFEFFAHFFRGIRENIQVKKLIEPKNSSFILFKIFLRHDEIFDCDFTDQILFKVRIFYFYLCESLIIF